MPTETPQGTRSRDGAELAGQRAAGGAQLGVEHGHLQRRLGHPVSLERREYPADRVARRAARCAARAGMRNRVSTSAAASTYSEEYSGSDIATHSPQPSASSVTTRSSSTSRRVSVPNEVRNGDTSGIVDAAQLHSGELHEVSSAARVRTYQPALSNPVEPPAAGHQGGQRLAHRDAPLLGARPGRSTRRVSMSRGTATSTVGAVERARDRRAVGRAPEPDDGAAGELRLARRAGDTPPAHAAATAGRVRSQLTSSRSLSSLPLMPSFMPP